MVTHARRANGRAAGRHRDARWRHVFAKLRQPVLAWIVAAAVLGGFALLGVTQPGSGKTSAPRPVPAMLPAPVTVPDSTSSPGNADPARHRPLRNRPLRHRVAATGQRTPRQPAATVAPTGPASAPPTASRPPAAPHDGGPAVLVRYFVTSVSGTAFQGEVDVVNNGRQPLAGWQIVLGLEGDQVTAVENASGFVSNGILLMQPDSSSEVVPPDGGTLRVFFAANGSQTMPLACALNEINCSNVA